MPLHHFLAPQSVKNDDNALGSEQVSKLRPMKKFIVVKAWFYLVNVNLTTKEGENYLRSIWKTTGSKWYIMWCSWVYYTIAQQSLFLLKLLRITSRAVWNQLKKNTPITIGFFMKPLFQLIRQKLHETRGIDSQITRYVSLSLFLCCVTGKGIFISKNLKTIRKIKFVN